MALTMVAEDSTYKCAVCSHFLSVKKGQLLPPCPSLRRDDGKTRRPSARAAEHELRIEARLANRSLPVQVTSPHLRGVSEALCSAGRWSKQLQLAVYRGR